MKRSGVLAGGQGLVEFCFHVGGGPLDGSFPVAAEHFHVFWSIEGIDDGSRSGDQSTQSVRAETTDAIGSGATLGAVCGDEKEHLGAALAKEFQIVGLGCPNDHSYATEPTLADESAG